MPRKKRGSDSEGAEIVSVRLDAKQAFTARLLARVERNTLSGVMQLALDRLLAERHLSSDSWDKKPMTAAQVADETWDVDPARRLMKLSRYHRDLRTDHQRRLWDLIWLRRPFSRPRKGIWPIPDYAAYVNWELVAKKWDDLNAVAAGNEDISALGRTEIIAESGRQPKGGKHG